jgi:cell wall assembly regulator SMI1
MGDLRGRIETAIRTIEEFGRGYLEFRLRPPATEAQILAVESEFGMRLPDSLRELYLLHDGQDQLTMTAPLFSSEPLAPLSRAIAVWRDQRDEWGLTAGHADLVGWEEMNADPELRAVPADIRWFPFGVFTFEYKQGLWVDLNPIPGQPSGQVMLQGPWAHPPQYVGPSVVDVLETYASHIERGHIGLTPFGFATSSWGFGPMSLPLEYVKRDLHEPHLPRFAVDIARTLPRTVAEVGDLAGIKSLALRHATSVGGLVGAAWFTLALLDSGDIDLAPLAGSDVHELALVGGVPELGVDLLSIKRLVVDVQQPADLRILDHLPALENLSIDLGDVDPNDHDWAVSTKLQMISLRSGSISSLGFVGQLPQLGVLRIQEPRNLGVSGLPNGVSIFLQVIDADISADIEQLAKLTLPSSFAGPHEWMEALDGVLPAGVWTEVYERGDTTTWFDQARLNWRTRTQALATAGLPPH